MEAALAAHAAAVAAEAVHVGVVRVRGAHPPPPGVEGVLLVDVVVVLFPAGRWETSGDLLDGNGGADLLQVALISCRWRYAARCHCY